MAIDAPKPVLDYYAAKNRHDIDAMIAPFAKDAVVKDEGETHTGRDAIRAWMEETTRKYAVTVEPETADEKDGELVVRAMVSGNFPGSPARLAYRFRVRGPEIAGLSIG